MPPSTETSAIGVLSEVNGKAWLTHGGERSEAGTGTALSPGDMIETAEGARVAVTFADRSTLVLRDQGAFAVDDFAFNPQTAKGDELILIARGAFSYVSGDIAHLHPDAARLVTPTMSIGIRGTTVAGMVGQEGVTSVALAADPGNGHVGEIILASLDGSQSFIINSAGGGILDAHGGESWSVTGEAGSTLLDLVPPALAPPETAPVMPMVSLDVWVTPAEAPHVSPPDGSIPPLERLASLTETVPISSGEHDGSILGGESGPSTGTETPPLSRPDLTVPITPTTSSVLTENGDLFIGGNYIELGINENGVLNSAGSAPSTFHPQDSSGSLGLVVDSSGFSTNSDSNTPDYSLPGTPFEGFSLGINGTVYSDIWPSSQTFSQISVDNLSSGETLAVRTTAVSTSATIEQTVSFEASDSYITTTVTIINTTDTALSNVRYLHTIDPDQDAFHYGRFDTENSVLSNPSSTATVALTQAVGPVSGDSIAYISFYDQSRGANSSSWSSNPYDTTLYESPVNQAGSLSDSTLTMDFYFPSIAANSSVTVTFYTSFNISTDGNDFLYTAISGTTLSGGSGNDILLGLASSDVLQGGTGDDTLICPLSDLATDTIAGGSGDNSLRLTGEGSIADSAFTAVSNISTLVLGDNESISLGSLSAMAGITKIDASATTGSETIDLSSRSDALTILTGSGTTTLTCGQGVDTIAINASGLATINNYSSSLDRLQLDNHEFGLGAAGTLSTSQYAESSTALSSTATSYGASGTAGIIAIDGSSGATLWYTSNLGAATTANSVEVAVLSSINTSALDHTQFHLAV